MKTTVYIKAYSVPGVDKKEVFRYASVKEENAELKALLDECISESADKLSYKVCYCFCPVSICGEELDLGFATVRSHSLSLCLEGCEEIILFCATVGLDFDRLIEKYNRISPAKATMLQALGSERVEALCDEFCKDMAREVGKTLRPRFSPGYGDLPLELQRDIFACLEPARRIGVTLGDNLFMIPSKSVTAIIGVKKEK